MIDAPQYELKSDLARWSMPSQRGQAARRLAWANSTCLLFLLIGIVGARTRTPIPRVPPPLEEAAPIVIAALPPPPPEAVKTPEQPEQEKAPAPVVVVVPNAPNINFSIPTVGTLVAPTALAQGLPSRAERESSAGKPTGPTHLDYTDASGDRPKPERYPPMAERLNITGSVVLDMTADNDGKILTVEVKDSSGSGILDRAAKDFVTLHWKLPKGHAGQIFETTFNYIFDRK